MTAHTDEETLVREHWPMVQRIAAAETRKTGRAELADPILSAAAYGLILAIRTFRAERDDGQTGRLHPWIVQTVRRRILDELRTEDHLTRNQRETQQRAAHNGHDPNPRWGPPLRLDYTPPDHDTPLAAFLADPHPGPDQLALEAEQRRFLGVALHHLPPRLRLVITHLVLLEEPAPLLATRLGLTDSRIFQLRSHALDLLRDAYGHMYNRPDLRHSSSYRTPGARTRARYVDAVMAHWRRTTTPTARDDPRPLTHPPPKCA